MVKTAASSSSSNNNKYKGVWKRKWGKYVSEIRLPNSRERIWLGSYETAEKAARAFDAALFCLRGRNAKFNFPEDPPNVISTNIPGAGKSLTPAEIQSVAQQYGNSFVHPKEFEDTIDWSFLDILDHDHLDHHEERDHAQNVYSSFGVFQETGDMYIPVPAPHSSPISGTDDHDHGSVADFTSFLWNFDSST